MTESIEVECSHCGMGFHPAAVYAVADRWRKKKANGDHSLGQAGEA